MPPPGWIARKEGYDNIDFTVKSNIAFHWFSHPYFLINIEPIEQNVHGAKGIYELVYFVKESKSLDRFKKQAQESSKVNEGKTDEDVEILVSLLTKNTLR